MRPLVHLRRSATPVRRPQRADRADRPDPQRAREPWDVRADASACGRATSVARANSYEAPSPGSQKSYAFTPTNCAALPFTGSAVGSVGAPGLTGRGDHPPVSTTLRFNPRHAALKRAEVLLPKSVAPSQRALARACTRPQANATACPESWRVGTAIVDSPLQARPVSGPVYLGFNPRPGCPG